MSCVFIAASVVSSLLTSHKLYILSQLIILINVGALHLPVLNFKGSDPLLIIVIFIIFIIIIIIG